jgi:TPR repeat protein
MAVTSLVGKYIVVLGVAVAVVGCAGAALEGANIAKDKAEAEANMSAAEAGNAEAQYKVGKSLCCSIDEGGPSFYNTEQAVAWLCKSAAQNYSPAALKLGDIYSGNTVSGMRVMRRAAEKVIQPRTNPPVAYAWLQRAQALGNADAAEPAAKVWQAMTPAQQAEASALGSSKAALPCEWAQVMGPA